MIERQLQQFFAHHILFSGLKEKEQETLCQIGRKIDLKNGENLFLQGSDASHFYLLITGKVNLYRLSPDGLTKVIEVVNPGQAFAEALMFIEEKKYPVSALAMGHCKVISIPFQGYKNILLKSPESALKLMGNMAKKLHQRINEIENLTLQNTRHRLGNYLSSLVKDPSALQSEFCLPMEKRLIASKLGMQPETFSRVFKEMRDHKILSNNGKHVQVHDMQALRSFGHEFE